jgi:predicted RNase H-like HicB family nuclease
MPKGQPYAYSLNFKIEKGYSGVIVAQCKEFPAIIVQGKDMSEIINKAKDALTGYFKAFPEKKKGTKYSTPVKNTQLEFFKILMQYLSADAIQKYEKLSPKQNNVEQIKLLTITR